MSLLNVALDLHDAGICVVPLATDGTKRPAVAWKQYQAQRPTREQVSAWFRHDAYQGLGALTGATSGNLELLEFEGRAVADGTFTAWLDALAAHGRGDLVDRLRGWWEVSPSGGQHFLYRVDGELGGNAKLARRPGEGQTVDVLIETRSEGGFVVLAPSGGASHPSGKPWQLLMGGASSIPTLTLVEREFLFAISSMFDEVAEEEWAGVEASIWDTHAHSGGVRPGDDFNAKARWEDILEPLGWRKVYTVGTTTSWVRPGKKASDGISATTGRTLAQDGQDRLFVFTTSTQFDAERPYSKFAAYCAIHHNGDFRAATRDLAAQGFGTQPREAVTAVSGSGDAGGDATVGEATSSDDEMRPRLDVTVDALFTDWLRANLGSRHTAGMFLRGDAIVHTPRVGDDGYVDFASDLDRERDKAGNPDGIAQVRMINASRLQAQIDAAYRCFKVGRGGEREAHPPITSCGIAVAAPEKLTSLRPLAGVVHTPILRRDGSLLRAPGYDEATGIIYLPHADLSVDVKDEPDSTDLEEATRLITTMLEGFAFVTPSDRANFIGVLLTPLLRLICPPPYKLTAITAHQPGSGKSLLASIARIIHGGVFRAEFPEDEPELRKQITSILTVTTGPVVTFDNLGKTLRSSTLAGLLTSATWSDRPLGVTEFTTAINDRLWIVTGNNVNIAGDLARRTLGIAIDPGVPNPELRDDFAIDDLEGWVKARRGQIIAALLTLARSWVLAGAKPADLRSRDSFGHWIAVVTGILEHAGIGGGFDADVAKIVTGASDDDEWADFLRAVESVFSEQAFTVAELLGNIDDGRNEFSVRTIGLDVLPAALAEKVIKSGLKASSRTLGRWLSNRDGRWAGDLCVRQAGKDRKGYTEWRVERFVQKNKESAEFAEFAEFDSHLHAENAGGYSSVTSVNCVNGPKSNSANSANSAPAQDELDYRGQDIEDHRANWWDR